MKRIITIIIVLGLLVPAVAVASRVATGSTRNAIDRVAAPQSPSGIPERCLFAQVTTKDGGNWAEVGFNGLRHRSCGRWGFNGVVILTPRSRALALRHVGFCYDPVWAARHPRRGPARPARAMSLSIGTRSVPAPGVGAASSTARDGSTA